MDKVKHFVVGSVIAAASTFGMYHIFYPMNKWIIMAVQIILVIAAASWKERKDFKTYGAWDWYDFTATVIPGILMGLIILNYF